MMKWDCAMSQLDQITALRISGEDISLAEVVRSLQLSGKTELLAEAARDLILQSEIRDRRLTVSDDQLQTAADDFRRDQKLERAVDTQNWLKERGWSIERLELHLERKLLHENLLNEIATDDAIRQHFAEHRRAYDQAAIAHLVVSDRAVAEELLSQIDEDDADFETLVREHSIDTTTNQNGGRLGLTNRLSMSPLIESHVFSASEGQVIGPFETKNGFHLIRIERLISGQLDENVSEAIRRDVFESWLDAEIAAANVEWTILREA
ncbi:MAG: parvulin-like peptidyl-prolyl isomerase [Porticoccaceae bacterium]|jgi:parvulin-like peptidyl-prolyl isomerase